jgi:hypothetical protein
MIGWTEEKTISSGIRMVAIRLRWVTARVSDTPQ